MNDGFLGILRLVAVAVQNAGFAVVIGVLLCRRWLARGESDWQADIGKRLAVALRAASVVSLFASALSFWAHCALMSDSTLFEAGPAVRSMLVGTGFGHAWLVGAGFTLCVVIGAFMSPASEVRYSLPMWIALAGVALARSHGGHPVDAGPFSLPVWVDWLHVLAISVWAGLVIVTAYVAMPCLVRMPGAEHRNGASFVQSLSDASTFALLVLLGTGAYNGWRGVQTSFSLLQSEYGTVLLLKLFLVLIAAVLGGHNRCFEMPKLLAELTHASAATPTGSLRRFARVLQVESLVLAGVLIVAAVLVSSPLPGTA